MLGKVEGVHPVTSELPVRTPALSVSVFVSSGNTFHLTHLLVVVRVPDGGDSSSPPLCVNVYMND